MRVILTYLLFSWFLTTYAQFDPAGGENGSRSVHKDDIAISRWGDSVVIARGWMDKADSSLGKASAGDSMAALGKADNAIISLGDGGTATYYFAEAIINKEGYDLAVFENGFALGDGYFLELAVVEVSVDGLAYHRFPCKTEADTNSQFNNASLLQPEQYHNLAGKHQAPYGTAFDLSEVKLDSIHFVRIIDVVGSLDRSLGTVDSMGHMINDPYPTAFASSGFDLDAVGIMGEGYVGLVEYSKPPIDVYPNIVRTNTVFNFNLDLESISIKDLSGKEVYSGSSRSVSITQPGIYILTFIHNNNSYSQKLCVY